MRRRDRMKKRRYVEDGKIGKQRIGEFDKDRIRGIRLVNVREI